MAKLGEAALNAVSFLFVFLPLFHSLDFTRPVAKDSARSQSSKPKKSRSEKAKSETKPAKSSSQKSGKSKKAGKELPWYADGLQFECSQCGDCCSGEPGYVFVDESEIEALLVETKLEREEFEKKFLRRVGRDYSLKEYPDGDCIFLDPKSRRCLVYNARPIQCRTWPFWDSTLAGPTDWKETCEACPGAGKGKMYSFEEIEIRRKEKSV